MRVHTVTLGVDPGLATLGYALLRICNDEAEIIDFGVIRSPAGLPLHERLVLIASDLQVLLDTYKPTASLVESLFFAKNTKTALDVAHARGVILETLAKNGLTVQHITPNQVKVAVCGDGSADKVQIQQFVARIFGLSSLPKPDDAADALAIAFAGIRLLK